MICPRCGTYMQDGAFTCENCGTLLSNTNTARKETGVKAIRQGRLGATPPQLEDDPRENIPEYGDYDMSPVPLEHELGPRRKTAPKGLASFASKPTTQRGVPIHTHSRARHITPRNVKTHAVHKHNINWMLIIIGGVVLLLLTGVGYTLYMNNSMAGQRITARRLTREATNQLLATAVTTDNLLVTQKEEALKKLGKATPQAYWLVGQEFLDVGDVEMAIRCFQIADILDPQNYDGLLLMANAYELNDNDPAAEEIYLRLLTDVAPYRTESYSALISMYRTNDRNPEAAEMMLKAYENTEKETFHLMRKDFIPNTPQIDLPAGRYMLEQTITLTSPQGYDIYYTLNDEATLPDEGILTENGSLTIPEGTLTLRAVCVNVTNELVSDPLQVTYTVYYPTPAAPKANLAPNTYKRLYAISLRPGEGSEEEELTYHYTIDGSFPNEESPVYDGTPIQMPSGRVMLRAICINGYGKMSPTMEIFYKFDVKPHPLTMYSYEDLFNGFTLGKTTPQEFTQTFGEPKEIQKTQYLYTDGEAQHMEYDWGHAVFLLTGNQWGLVRVEMNREIAKGPRNVGFGSTETDITGVFKDFGQLQSPNGNRGLYYEDPSIGKITQNEDGSRTVQYTCATLDSKKWVLQYHLKDKRVIKICHYYQP